jgi:hypothetical protein
MLTHRLLRASMAPILPDGRAIAAREQLRCGPGDDDEDDDETPIGDPEDDEDYGDDEDDEDDDEDTMWADGVRACTRGASLDS